MALRQGSGHPRRYTSMDHQRWQGGTTMNLSARMLHTWTPAPTNQMTPHGSVALRQTSRAGSLIGIRACITPKTHTGSSTGMAGRRDIGSRMRQSRRGHQYHRHLLPFVRESGRLRRARNPRRCHAREPHPQARFLHGIASRHLLIDRLRLARVLSAVHGMPCSTHRRRKLPGIALSSAILPPNPMGVDLGKYQLGTESCGVRTPPIGTQGQGRGVRLLSR